MSVMVSLNIPFQPDKLDEALALFATDLGDTRAFEGCERLESFIDRENSRILLIEQWAEPANHEAYMGWRAETGFIDKLGPLLAGAPESTTWEISTVY